VPHAAEVKVILNVIALSDFSFFWEKSPKHNQYKETPGLLEREKGFNYIRTIAKSQASRGTEIAGSISDQPSLSSITTCFWE